MSTFNIIFALVVSLDRNFSKLKIDNKQICTFKSQSLLLDVACITNQFLSHKTNQHDFRQKKSSEIPHYHCVVGSTGLYNSRLIRIWLYYILTTIKR